MVLLCLLILSSPLLAQETLPALVKKIQPSTVLIITYDEKGKELSIGSGFFISENGDIITNRHVLIGAHKAEIKASDGEIYPITQIVAEDKEADIIRASVKIPNIAVHHLSISTSIPEVGERIVVIGNPLGLEQTVSEGIVSAVREIPVFGKIIQISAPMSPGSSGSPVINMNGEVIGVATFQFVKGQNLNFAIPGERVAKLKPEKNNILTERQLDAAGEWIIGAEGLYRTGLLFGWAEEYKKALPYFKKAVEKDPRYANAWFFIGYCNSKLGHLNEAIDAFKQAIRIKSDFAEAHYNFGNAYCKLGRYTEEIEAYKQAIRIKPDYAEVHYNLGVAYCKLGRDTEAIDAFKQAIRIKPDFAEAHYNLGVAYLIIGDKGYSLNQYMILKKLNSELANQLFNLIYK